VLLDTGSATMLAAVTWGLGLITALALGVAAGFGRLAAIATAPRALAAPAPRVMADTHASPLLRAA
jgi:hypothetical protein